MKKWLKILLVLIGVIFSCVTLDFISIFTLGKPIFAIPVRTPYTYTGIFYDTYNCPEYSVPQIKVKGTKFSCATGTINTNALVGIVDTTKDIKNFSCAEALEQFYEDEENKYYYSCIKSKYVIVKYQNGYEETVKSAFENGTNKIKDLDPMV